MLQRLGSSWGFGALLKGTSVVVLKVDMYIHSRTFDYVSDSLPLGHDFPTPV